MGIWTSMLLLTVCGASTALGLHALRKGIDTRLRIWFLAACAALDVWAFGLAIKAGAYAETISVLGGRLANAGWSLTACAITAFLYELTGARLLFKKWWFSLVAYLPSAFAVAGFVVLPFLGINMENMMRTDFGWVNVADIRSGWYYINIFQIVSFLAIGLGLLLRWIICSDTADVIRQARILFFSTAAAGILGIGTDLLPSIVGVRMPLISPVFALVPLGAIAYMVRRYHFLQPVEENPYEIFITDRARTRVYDFLGLIAGICAALTWFTSSGTGSDLFALLMSIFLLAVAVCIIAVNWIRTDNPTRELVLALGVSLVIPVTALWSTLDGNLTVWTFVFALIIASLLFNKLNILITIVVSSLFTQTFIWAFRPVQYWRVSTSAYVMRFMILITLTLLTCYVHFIYVRRLKENANHTTKQMLVSQTSRSFLAVDQDTLDETLDETLERCGKFIRCDRAYLVLLDRDGKTVRYSRTWRVEDTLPELGDFAYFLSGVSRMGCMQQQTEDIIVLKDAALLPPAAGAVRKTLLEKGIRALVAIPLKNEDETIGFLGFHAGIPLRKWNLEDASFLRIIAGIISESVIKLEAEQQVCLNAYHDHLTGLPNRLLFNERLMQAISLTGRTEKMFAVVFIDLDSFKAVNDTMGHEAGDRLLRQVARTLSRIVRRYDTVSRFGGDEFILLLNQISDPADVEGIMNKLMEPFQHAFPVNGQEVFVTVSAGVALFPQDGTDAETLIKNADMAMYHAKDVGKNGYAFCTQAIKDDILDKMRLSNLLYRAIERDQLTLYYQPQVDTQSRTIVGCEALIRWSLPDRGIIMPSVLIPLAEQTGLIQSIGEWVLETACLQNKAWHALGFTGLRMAVNLSVHQLKNPEFVQNVEDILVRTGLEPQFLELEITESAANGNIDNMVEILNALKALGVSISIDDFGAEYSSLSRLKQMPVDRIKIDKQFIQGIDRNEKDQAISKVIISLTKSLDLKVIAEGVETAPQLAFLSQRMCDEVQGYFYYRPMPANEMERILTEQPEAAGV